MTPQQISADIERGIELRKDIKAAQNELKAIEKRLEQAGLEGEHIPLQEEDREGRQYLARSPKLGLIIPVVFESDQIIGSVSPGTDIHANLTRIADYRLPEFFRASDKLDRVPKDGQAFRKLARELLAADAPEFISAALQRDKSGIPKSRTIIAWENAKPIAHNVKEHAPLSAGASVDHGVDVVTTGEHENRAADRGCCVSTCSPS